MAQLVALEAPCATLQVFDRAAVTMVRGSALALLAFDDPLALSAVALLEELASLSMG